MGPRPLLHGAILASREYDVRILLVGRGDRLERRLKKYGEFHNPRLEIVHATDVVGMGEKPMDAVRRRDASVNVAARLVRDGHAEALVSAGNTGATKAAATLTIGRLKGVKRPALATLFPTQNQPTLLLDVGATPDCRPEFLQQFAIMGSAYMRNVMGLKRPRVGLLSIGEEEGKGNMLVQDAYKLLAKTHLNFVGNAEGRDIVRGTFDVIVCDGFVGNSMLKFGEGLALMVLKLLKAELTSNPVNMLLATALGPAFTRFKKRVDYEEWGGAPLLGIDGACIVGHGSSSEKAVKNAIRTAGEMVVQNVNPDITAELAKSGEAKSEKVAVVGS